MERMTYWNTATQRFEVNDHGTIHYGSIVDKLAEYENTEFTPKAVENLDDTVRVQSNSIIRLGEQLEDIRDVQKKCDYWELEAKKWAAKLADLRYRLQQEICSKCPYPHPDKCRECQDN